MGGKSLKQDVHALQTTELADENEVDRVV